MPSLTPNTPGETPSQPPVPPEDAAQQEQTRSDVAVVHDAVTTPGAPRPSSAVRVPGFDVLEKLGEGGMGIVFRARQLDLDRIVALKLLRAGPLAGEQLLARFHVEEKAVARLDHPGVVRIHSTGQHDGWVYFCMEFVPGGSLAGRLRDGPLDVRQAAEMVRQLALAVQHAHEAGVLHRDLKPGNVLLTADARPKVGDFGLAKLLDAEDGLTQSGALMGTPSYLAPEQARGEARDVGPTADVYALGAVLYECLTGRPPLRGATRSETLELVKTQPPIPPRRLRADVPAELEGICLACLEKQPSDRPPSAAALADDLAAWLAGQRTRSRPRRPWRHLFRKAGRWRVAMTVGVVLLSVVAVAVALWNRQPGIELIGAKGLPREARWWQGDEDAKFELDDQGACSIDAKRLTLVELLPDTKGHKHYRLQAEIRHQRAGHVGFVGLYVAGSTNRTAEVPVPSFLQVKFNDCKDELETYNSLPRALQAKLSAPRGNCVFLDSCYYAEFKPTGLDYECRQVNDACFLASGHGGKATRWRKVEVEVDPDQVSLFWEGELLRKMPLAKIQSQDSEKMQEVLRIRRARKEQPSLAGFVPGLNPRGGLGLTLLDSRASFKNVRFVPLDKPGHGEQGRGN